MTNLLKNYMSLFLHVLIIPVIMPFPTTLKRLKIKNPSDLLHPMPQDSNLALRNRESFEYSDIKPSHHNRHDFVSNSESVLMVNGLSTMVCQ